jgi:hypothetical protein
VGVYILPFQSLRDRIVHGTSHIRKHRISLIRKGLSPNHADNAGMWVNPHEQIAGTCEIKQAFAANNTMMAISGCNSICPIPLSCQHNNQRTMLWNISV